MAKVRKFVAYRRMERPYTRKSKYREKSFIRGDPRSKVIRWNMGDAKGDYDYTLTLHNKADLQIRDRAIESARLVINRHAEKKIGIGQYYFRIKCYPHHHLRENALASGAGADRLSTGMKFSFGKVVDIAAQCFAGKELFSLSVKKSDLEKAKKIIHLAATKLPGSVYVRVKELK